MRLQILKPNFTRVTVSNSVSFYFSYGTVIGFNDNGKVVITGKKYSKTTSKHQHLIRDYELGGSVVDEREFDSQLCKLQERLSV